MVSVLAKLMGDANEKAIKNIHPIVQEINGLEAATKALSDSDLRKKNRGIQKPSKRRGNFG